VSVFSNMTASEAENTVSHVPVLLSGTVEAFDDETASPSTVAPLSRFIRIETH
jgi:hypothetical protein